MIVKVPPGLACALAFAFTAFPFAAFAETPVAVVSGSVITLEKLNQVLGSMPSGLPPGVNDSFAKNAQAMDILKRMIDSELLYLEATVKGVQNDPDFKKRSENYRDIALADMYRRKLFDEKAGIPEDDVKKLSASRGITREAARALLSSGARKRALKSENARLYDKYKVEFSPILAGSGDVSPRDDEILAASSIFKIAYGDVKGPLSNFGSRKKDMIDFLAGMAEEKLFAAEGREAGLDASDAFRKMTSEFDRSLAVNIHHQAIDRSDEPSDKDINEYIAANEYLKFQPRHAAVLMIVTKTREEAEAVRKDILSGANFHELAIQRSIAPDAKANAGEIGTLTIGEKPYNAMDKAILSTKQGEVTHPIAGARGYSVFKLLEITGENPRDLKEASEMARQSILEERFEKHLDKLRRSGDVKILDPATGAK